MIKLYVGNLPPDITNERLAEIFTSAGRVVAANVEREPLTGEPRGYGFVDMADDVSAKSALQLNLSAEIDGHLINVSAPNMKRYSRRISSRQNGARALAAMELRSP